MAQREECSRRGNTPGAFSSAFSSGFFVGVSALNTAENDQGTGHGAACPETTTPPPTPTPVEIRRDRRLCQLNTTGARRLSYQQGITKINVKYGGKLSYKQGNGKLIAKVR